MAKGKKKQPKMQIPQGWYYMCTEEKTVSDLAKQFDAEKYDVEVWIEAGVLEIGVEEKISIDIESCDLDLRDEYSNQFLEDHKIKTLFYVSFKPDGYEQCMPLLKQMVSNCGGMLCGDTEDFSPMVGTVLLS